MFGSGRGIYWQIAASLAVITVIAMLSRSFPIVDLLQTAQTQVAGWGAWSAVCYPLLFATCNILLLPGGVLAAGGGFFFGLWWGFFLVFAGNVLSTALSFALSRGIANRWFRSKLSEHQALRALRPAVEREGWKIILLSQLHPLFPTSLLNYLYGLTTISYQSYMLWASIGRIPGLFLYVYVGTLGQYGLRIVHGSQPPRVVDYWTWSGAFVITVLLLLVLGRLATRAIGTAREQSRGEIPNTLST